MKRTQDEIVKRFEARQEHDFGGFECNCYLECLDFEHVKPYLKDGVTPDQWEQKTEEDVRKEAIEYMSFAWDKANNCRGISANRSIMHYIAWLWLLGEDGYDDLMDDYEFYGKPQLERICKYFGLDPKQWDDSRRSNVEY